MKMFINNLLGVLCVCVTLSAGANILGVFYFPSKSHHILGNALFKELALRGHNVTYISSFSINEKISNFTHIETDIVSLEEESSKKFRQGNSSLLDKLKMFKNSKKLSQTFFENPNIKWFLGSDSKFDLLIHFMAFDPTLYFAHHFDVPVVAFAAVGGFPLLNDITGNPSPYSYVPSTFLPLTDEMSFLERVINVLANIAADGIIRWAYLTPSNELLKEQFPNSPTMEILHERVDLVLVNTHVSIETPRPYVPNMIQIGGFHLQEKEVLPKEIQQYLDRATEGVVYFGFGTNVNVSSLPQEKLNIFKSTLGRMPMKILWKYELNEMQNKPENVNIGTWFPQRAVLAHPNVKLFISHGGYGGCTESLYYGVPMVCIPFFGDQMKNCADAVSKGFAESISIDELTESKFSEILTRVLHDSSFIENAKLKSDIYRNQPMNPMDKAVFWVEHVLKHKGAKHLKVKALNLSWYQYYLLDVFVFLLGVVVVSFYVMFFVCKLTCRKLFHSKSKLKTN